MPGENRLRIEHRKRYILFSGERRRDRISVVILHIQGHLSPRIRFSALARRDMPDGRWHIIWVYVSGRSKSNRELVHARIATRIGYFAETAQETEKIRCNPKRHERNIHRKIQELKSMDLGEVVWIDADRFGLDNEDLKGLGAQWDPFVASWYFWSRNPNREILEQWRANRKPGFGDWYFDFLPPEDQCERIARRANKRFVARPILVKRRREIPFEHEEPYQALYLGILKPKKPKKGKKGTRHHLIRYYGFDFRTERARKFMLDSSLVSWRVIEDLHHFRSSYRRRRTGNTGVWNDI